ncbi:MAG: transcription elongation factor GreA [Clostridia bacterium]|nr:transcription elongation factor GreA [Clostridia bacterium]
MEKKVKVTKEGLKQLEDRLEYLKTTGREEMAKEIAEARAQGDLSENAEYDEAKNAQARMEAEIQELEKKLKNIEIIESGSDDKTVGLGATVKVVIEDEYGEEEAEYTIVGSTEADPSKNKISDESPIGRALVGKAVGKTVEVETPGGLSKIKIKKIVKK